MIQVKITDKNGLHARPASLVVSIARKYPGKVFLEKEGVRCNAKNILSIMALEAVYGDVVNVIACGKYSDQTEEKIEAAIRKFDRVE